jgi:hypothetical protein
MAVWKESTPYICRLRSVTLITGERIPWWKDTPLMKSKSNGQRIYRWMTPEEQAEYDEHMGEMQVW